MSVIVKLQITKSNYKSHLFSFSFKDNMGKILRLAITIFEIKKMVQNSDMDFFLI